MEAGLRVELISPPGLQVGAANSLRYVVTDARTGGAASDIVASHGRPAHLIVVRSDLERFQHLHPEPLTVAAFLVSGALAGLAGIGDDVLGELRGEYGDESLQFGERPYAEVDAQAMDGARGSHLRSEIEVPAGP